jgi:hypothetical protein
MMLSECVCDEGLKSYMAEINATIEASPSKFRGAGHGVQHLKSAD